MTLRGILITTTLTALASVLAVGAQAASLIGDNIIYEYDDTQAAIAFYGTPTIVGDTVVFTPGTAFRAQSANGVALNTPSSPTDIVTSSFIFDRVYHKDGDALMGLYVGESGDYRIDGNSGSVEVDLFLQGVTNPGGGTLGSGDVSANLVISGDSSGQQSWGGVQAVLDLTAFETPPYIGGGGPAGPQTDVKVTIQNTLYATTAAGTGDLAWIQKKLTFTAVVPIPAAVWLFGSAILGLVAVGRRKTAIA